MRKVSSATIIQESMHRENVFTNCQSDQVFEDSHQQTILATSAERNSTSLSSFTKMPIHPARRTLCCQCTRCSMLIVDFGFLGHSTAMPKNWFNDLVSFVLLFLFESVLKGIQATLKATPSTPSNNKGWIRPSYRKLVVNLNIHWLNRYCWWRCSFWGG